MNIDLYIAQLLEEHDCVIVPDFGGFVGNYAPARINPINDRFDPPYRKVSFNRLLVHNDGLLAACIAKHENEQFEKAMSEVKHYVIYLKESLKDQRQVSIEKVGMIYRQEDGSLRFEQFDNPSFFKDGFGLSSFFGKRIDRTRKSKIIHEPKAERIRHSDKRVPEITPIKEIAPADESKQPDVSVRSISDVPKPAPISEQPPSSSASEDAQKKVKNRSYWPAVAAVIALPIVGYAIWVSLSTPLFKDRSQFHASDLNPFSEKICTTYQVRTGGFNIATEENEAVSIDEHAEFMELKLGNNPDKTLVVKLSSPEKSTRSNSDLRYHVIGGCFSVMSNAKGLVEHYESQGKNASIVDQIGNLHRVSVQSFATKKEAVLALASIQNDIPGAWLLYK